MSNEINNRVFLSYAREDLNKVRPLYEGLVKRGLIVWFAEKNLKGGKWKEQIRKAINRSRHFVICISKAALKKTGEDTPGFQDKELNYACSIAEDHPESEFKIYPVRIEDCNRGDFRLTAWQQYDLFEDLDKGLDKLAVHMGGNSLSDATAKDDRSEDEKFIDDLFAKANATYYAGSYEKSVNWYRVILDEAPDHLVALSNLGVSLGNLGSFEEALDAFDRVLEINPNDSISWSNKAAIFGFIGRFEDELHACEKALQIDPTDDYAWSNKGAALQGLGRYEEALDAIEKALEINSNHAKAWYNKGVNLYFLGRINDALYAYDNALEIEPDYIVAWLNKGTALSSLGRYEEALVAYDIVLEIDSDYASAWTAKGAVLHNLNRYKEALVSHDKALEIDSGFAFAWFNKGSVLKEMGRYKEALDAFNEGLEFEPDDQNALNCKNELIKLLNGNR